MSAYGRSDWLTEIGAIQREMERLLDHYAGAKPPLVQFAKHAFEPSVDVYETESEVVIVVDLAGVDKEKLQISADRKTIIIRGQRSKPGSGLRRSYYLMEIATGFFERTIPLPVTADPAKAEANYRDGMMEIVIPKDGRQVTNQMRVIITQKGQVADGN